MPFRSADNIILRSAAVNPFTGFSGQHHRKLVGYWTHFSGQHHRFGNLLETLFRTTLPGLGTYWRHFSGQHYRSGNLLETLFRTTKPGLGTYRRHFSGQHYRSGKLLETLFRTTPPIERAVLFRFYTVDHTYRPCMYYHMLSHYT